MLGTDYNKYYWTIILDVVLTIIFFILVYMIYKGKFKDKRSNGMSPVKFNTWGIKRDFMNI